jgi:UDP-N-acetylmuramoylalanine--D-glutamate ligase
MDFTNKKIGIWGFGIVGKAALPYLKKSGATLTLFDRRPLNLEEQALANQWNATIESNLESFLSNNDLILPSPGVDLRAYQQYAHKWISELDIFATHFKKPIIAITGTVGKTSTTKLIAHLLQSAGKKVAMGGNVGIGILDLLATADTVDIAVVEVSSFQLELCKKFAPHIALWTNLYENHLDRHGTMADYQAAKAKIFAHQSVHDYSILPLNLAGVTRPKTKTIYFSLERPKSAVSLSSNGMLIYVDGQNIIKKTSAREEKIVSLEQLNTTTFLENSIAAIATLLAAQVPTDSLVTAINNFSTQEHRLEKIAVDCPIDIYNDSKSTITQATVAAVKKLQGKPIILLVGGLSKGVDRSPLFEQLQSLVSRTICFGTEADNLHAASSAHHIPSTAVSTLEEAVALAFTYATPGDQILFSPAGSSYDLFKNFEDRGNRFKQLVMLYTQKTV